MRVSLCYIDESGCTGALSGHAIQPVLVIGGLIVPQERLSAFTADFLHLKSRFYPGAMNLGGPYLERMLVEVKGADLRRYACLGGRRTSRQAIGFLDHLLRMVEGHNCRLVGRVWIKAPGVPFDGRAVYTRSIQSIYTAFERYLADGGGDAGFVIADSRTKPLNAIVAHSVFTQKHKSTGDSFPHIAEMPTFGHSDNHAGLQVADLIASALVFPMAVVGYCLGLSNLHVRPEYRRLRERFAQRLERLQYRYQDEEGRWRGGWVVSDALGKQSGSRLFHEPPPPATP
jgi:hypothetical protein